jgi:hypothetical protein
MRDAERAMQPLQDGVLLGRASAVDPTWIKLPTITAGVDATSIA